MQTKISEQLDSIDAPDLWEESLKRSYSARPLRVSSGRTRRVVPALVLILFIASLGAVNRWRWIEPSVRVSQINPTYDVTDPRRVVGHSSHVWVGKVLEEDGTYPMDDEGHFRATQFRVRVLEEIKGELGSREVLVRQQGWLNKLLNEVHLVENDPLLRPGEVVLFATTPLMDDGRPYQLMGTAKYGTIRIRSNEEQAEVVAKYRDAYRNQITFDDEVAGR